MPRRCQITMMRCLKREAEDRGEQLSVFKLSSLSYFLVKASAALWDVEERGRTSYRTFAFAQFHFTLHTPYPLLRNALLATSYSSRDSSSSIILLFCILWDIVFVFVIAFFFFVSLGSYF